MKPSAVRPLYAVMALAVGLLTACGDVDSNGAAAGRAAARPAAEPPTSPRAPALPEPPEPAGEAAAPTLMPGEPDTADGGVFLGYVGERYAPPREGGDVVVLTDALRQATGTGRWRVNGLVRNEGLRDVTAVTVTARLRGSSADVLATVSAQSPIRPLRPGEPAPFQLHAAVPASAVKSVEWSVRATPVAANTARGRRIALTPAWEQPYGQRPRHDGYPLTDPPQPPYPYALFGSLQNRAKVALGDVQVWAAYLDEERRVVHVARVPLTGPGRAQRLQSGGTVDFRYTTDDPALASRLAGTSRILWAQGS